MFRLCFDAIGRARTPAERSADLKKAKPRFLRTIQNMDELSENRLTVISLFSGCGGMDLGCIQAGLQVRVMIDHDPICCETLAYNFLGKRRFRPKGILGIRPPAILCRDIRTLPTEEILQAAELQVGECGVVTGGFPCQGFSFSGHRCLNDARNLLYKECVRVVREALPKAFMFENVPGLVSMAKGQIINAICRELAECGYTVCWQTLNAADFGVPQNRIRVFFLGQRNDALAFDCKTGRTRLHLGVGGQIRHPEWYEKRYKIKGDLPADPTPAAKNR